jgi:hypothetical protein
MLFLVLSAGALAIAGAGTALAQDQDPDADQDQEQDNLSSEESIFSDEPFTTPRDEDDEGGAGTADPDLNESGGDPDTADNETELDENATTEPPSGGLFSLSPTEWALSMLYGLADRALLEIEASIDMINNTFVGLPAPGELSSPESWHNPTDGWWPGIYFAMGVAQVFGILWLVFQAAVAFSYSSKKKQRAAWKRLGFASVMVLGATLFGPLGLHLFGEAATSVVPEGEQFTESFGDFAQFGLGVTLGAILVFIAAKVVALGILAIVSIYVLAHIVLMFWPLMWAAWSSQGQARSYGSTGIYLYGTVCAIALLQAFFLLAMFHIDWMEGPLGPLGGVLGLVGGLLFSLIYFPITLLKQAHIAGAVGLGVAAANSAAGAFDGPRSAAVRNVEQRFEQKWQTFRNGGPQQRPQVGQVSSGYDGAGSPSQSRGSGSAGGSSGVDAKNSGPVMGRPSNSERDRIDYTHKK